MKKLTRSQKIKGWVFLGTALASPITLGWVPYFVYAMVFNGTAFESLTAFYIMLGHAVIWSMIYFPMVDTKWPSYSPLIKRT